MGEPQSELTNLDKIIEDSLGELYQDRLHQIINRPLDIGRYVYAKLRRELPDHIGEEIWWDHNNACLDIEVRTGNAVITTRLHEDKMADSRILFIAQVQQLVNNIMAEVAEWL